MRRTAPTRWRTAAVVAGGAALVAGLHVLPAAPAGAQVAGAPDVAGARGRVSAAEAQVTEVSARLDQAAAAFEVANAHAVRIEDELVGVDQQLVGAQAQVDHADEVLRRRVVAAYMRPDAQIALAQAVLGAPDVASALHRTQLLGRMAVQQSQHVERAMAAQALTSHEVRQHRVVEAGAAAAAGDRRREAEDLALALGEARSQLAGARSALATAEAQAAAARRAEEQRRRLEAERAAAAARAAVVVTGPPGPVSVDGRACPIGTPNGFIDSWGFPRSGGRTHQGVDMFAAYGTPIYAVADGVVQVGSNSLGGLTIDLHDRAGHRYYYAHLASFTVTSGEQVRAGQVIGANGDSGNARGTPPHLHWQYHPGGGPPVNPYPLAHALCR